MIPDMLKNIGRNEAFSEIITNNREMYSVFQYIESIAHSTQPILITGETGVGKELIARCIHRVSSVRGKWVVINVSGLDDNMFSDTLFGHVRGAFTGADKARRGMIEEAAGGTLFLDEIGDLSQVSQVKLLRLLQEREYMPLGQDTPKYTDVHIIAATNVDLWLFQRKGLFRKDLNYRLRTHHVHVPPLRDRPDDLPMLVDYFLDEASNILNKKKPTPPKQLYTLLQSYSFPGNIRELRAMIFDAVSRHKSKVLSLDVFRGHIERTQAGQTVELVNEAKIDEEAPFRAFKNLPTIKEASRMLVNEAMYRSHGNQSIAAKMLGISQPALSKRLKKQSEIEE